MTATVLPSRSMPVDLPDVAVGLTFVTAPPDWEKGRPVSRLEFRPLHRAPYLLCGAEMAMAVHYTGASLSYDMTADEVAGLVALGVKIVGLDRLRYMAARSCELGLSGLVDDEAVKEFKRLWPYAKDRSSGRSTGLTVNLFNAARGEPFNTRERLRQGYLG